MFDSINRKKAVQVLVIVMVACALLAGIIFFVQFQSSGFSLFSSDLSYKNKVDEEKSAAPDGIQTITVKSTSDDINIITDSSSEIKAHFYGSYSSSDDTFKPKLIVEKNGDNLSIRIDNTQNLLNFMVMSNLKLDVHIPESFDKELDITSTSGEVASEEIKLDKVHIKTTSGDIAVKSADAASGAFNSTSGEINIGGAFGKLEVHSTSGTIVSENLTAANGKLNSTSGEIKLKGSVDGITAAATSGTIIIDTDRLTKDTAVSTTSGEIIVKLPADSDFNLNAKSLSGDIKCSFPITVTGNNTHNNLKGTVGKGSCNLSLSSTSGDINIAE